MIIFLFCQSLKDSHFFDFIAVTVLQTDFIPVPSYTLHKAGLLKVIKIELNCMSHLERVTDTGIASMTNRSTVTHYCIYTETGVSSN